MAAANVHLSVGRLSDGQENLSGAHAHKDASARRLGGEHHQTEVDRHTGALKGLVGQFTAKSGLHLLHQLSLSLPLAHENGLVGAQLTGQLQALFIDVGEDDAGGTVRLGADQRNQTNWTGAGDEDLVTDGDVATSAGVHTDADWLHEGGLFGVHVVWHPEKEKERIKGKSEKHEKHEEELCKKALT